MAARAKPSRFIGWLAEASRAVCAVTSFLEHVVGLLQQLVRAAGWVDLLIAAVILPLQPHMSPAQLIAVPGTGVLAVLQSLIRPRRQAYKDMVVPDAGLKFDTDLSPHSEGDHQVHREAHPDRTKDV